MALLLAERDQAMRSGLAIAVVTGYVGAFGWAMGHTTYDVWGALIIGPLLVAVSMPVLTRIAHNDPDRKLRQLLVAALLCKLLSSVVRYSVALGVYGGLTDAGGYSGNGALLAEQFRYGDFTADIGHAVVGTGFIVIVTGVVYAIIGPSLIGGFLVYSWLGFWGLVFFYRALRIGFPGGDLRRYAVLLFFLPSLLYWPSSIGKDAWMMLTLGLCAYGAALILTHRRGGFCYLALGVLGTLMVRPHVTLLVVAALGVGYVLRRAPGRPSALGPVRTLAGVGVLGAGFMLVIERVGRFFGTDSFNADTVNSLLTSTQQQTTGGGSSFDSQFGGSVARLPQAVVTVLFRPFPSEAHNAQTLLAALEGTLLLLLFVLSWRRLRHLPALIRKRPYLGFCLVYTLLFCFAFSSFSNFGILTRERVQVFPMALAFLAIPPRPAAPPRRSGAPTSLARTANPP